jgi:hypothetical protein
MLRDTDASIVSVAAALGDARKPPSPWRFASGPAKRIAIGGGAGVSSNRSTVTAIAVAQRQLRSARSSRCPHPTGWREKMIWKSIVSPRAITLASARWSTMAGFARKTAETVFDFASVVYNLVMDVRDSYRPELHYMRGPGPKWRAKHQPWRRLDSEAAGQHQPSPVRVRGRNAAAPR